MAGDILDRKPGDWFGPAATAHLLKAALETANRNSKKSDFNLLSDLKIYVAQDTTVYKQDILDLCVKTFRSKETSPNYDEAFEDGIEAEGFSILSRDSAEVFIVENGRNENSSLEAGAMAGVPYFSDRDILEKNFVRIERESFQGQPASEEVTKYYSLQGHISVDGEEWTVETLCDDPAKKCDKKQQEFPAKKLYPSLSKEFEKVGRNVDEEVNWTPVLVLVPVRLGGESRLNPVYGSCVQVPIEECLRC